MLTACGGGGGSSSTTSTPPVVTYTLTVNSASPASGVTIVVSPADNNSTANGTTSFTRTYNSGATVVLTAPATSGSNAFSAWSGCTTSSTVTCNVTMSANATVTATYVALKTPTVSVTPGASSITTMQALTVTAAVNGGTGNPTPTGKVVLTSGSYTSAAATLINGSGTITVPAGSLAVGSDTLSVAYTPDTGSASAYKAATGTSSPVTVSDVQTSVTVDLTTAGPAVTDKLLGMNMAYWYDQSNSAIIPAFKTAGITAMRWPGGSGSDDYHWANNTLCSGTGTALSPVAQMATAAFPAVVNELIAPAKLDVALTADYGTNAACTGPGDPTEAAAWAASALSLGANVSHITVGNEEYGSWEEDLHAKPNDAATYASATATGYYPDIKAVSPHVLVGVEVNPGNVPAWDPIVLAQAKYDFVEFHYYPQGPFNETDDYLVRKAANDLTTSLNTIKTELATAGNPNTPIYVGEIGSVYTTPGKQSTSITQALYAGQALGEMMNAGVSRATWWIGFGGCDSDPTVENFSSSLYGWQNYGGYMVFSDGLPEYGCESAGSLPAGTLLPTARAFQLFSQVAVDGEHALNASVNGDTDNVRAYAATNNGGTALMLFNLNQASAQPVTVTLNGQSSSSSVTVTTYSKALYDQSANGTWAAPTTTSMGSQNFPLTLNLDPWSMNVVIVK